MRRSTSMTPGHPWPTAGSQSPAADFEKLSAAYREEGYLFFRNVLDSDAILKAKREFVRVLQKQ